MNLSSARFNPELPYWQDYLSYLQGLAGPGFPSCSQLNALLPGGLDSVGGKTIRFVNSNKLDDENYEYRIYTTGQVSTRPNSWHDLFNAMVWMRFPSIKTAMNSLHYKGGAKYKSGRRGPLRDALTLFDECGAIVFSGSADLLTALIERRWTDAFLSTDFNTSASVAICGHALLEKYLSPYKSITAKALLVHVDSSFMNLPRHEMLKRLDQELSGQMLNGRLLTEPAFLSPLPLAGIPGWWPVNEQKDDEFYDDPCVFRPAPKNPRPAPILKFQVCASDKT